MNGLLVSNYPILRLLAFLAEHWDQLVGIIYWLYFLLMNLTSNSIQILNAGCQANPWKSDFKLSLE